MTIAVDLGRKATKTNKSVYPWHLSSKGYSRQMEVKKREKRKGILSEFVLYKARLEFRTDKLFHQEINKLKFYMKHLALRL